MILLLKLQEFNVPFVNASHLPSVLDMPLVMKNNVCVIQLEARPERGKTGWAVARRYSVAFISLQETFKAFGASVREKI